MRKKFRKQKNEKLFNIVQLKQQLIVIKNSSSSHAFESTFLKFKLQIESIMFENDIKMKIDFVNISANDDKKLFNIIILRKNDNINKNDENDFKTFVNNANFIFNRNESFFKDDNVFIFVTSFVRHYFNNFVAIVNDFLFNQTLIIRKLKIQTSFTLFDFFINHSNSRSINFSLCNKSILQILSILNDCAEFIFTKFIKSRVEVSLFFENYNYFVEIFFNYDEASSLRRSSTSLIIENNSSIFKHDRSNSLFLNNCQWNVKRSKKEIDFDFINIQSISLSFYSNVNINSKFNDFDYVSIFSRFQQYIIESILMTNHVQRT